MAETKVVVENREQLWSLLIQAAQVEHLIMCQYLYASFSLKAGPDEGLTAEQADAVGRWHELLTGIAIEEMLHLALVANLKSAPRPRRPPRALRRAWPHTCRTRSALAERSAAPVTAAAGQATGSVLVSSPGAG